MNILMLHTLGCVFKNSRSDHETLQIYECVVGWKVLLTSRNEEVALHADKQCVTFKPECLTFEDSWDLFQRIAFPIKDTTSKSSRTVYLIFFFYYSKLKKKKRLQYMQDIGSFLNILVTDVQNLRLKKT